MIDEVLVENTYRNPEGNPLILDTILLEKIVNEPNITLLLNDAPGHKEIAVAIQSMWKELGLSVTIKQQEWAQFLEFIGPPPDKSVDVYRLGWIGDFVDDINFLEMWTCDSGNNSTNFCDKTYDQQVEEVRNGNLPEDERFQKYADLEQMLFGPEGEVPIIPIYWYTYVNLERENIKETFNLNLLDQVDLTQVEVAG